MPHPDIRGHLVRPPASNPEQRLYGAPLIHGTVAFSHVGERQIEVEHLAV
jgi:hypothetical protein